MADLIDIGQQVHSHLHVLLPNLFCLRRILRGVDQSVRGLTVEKPLLQRDAQHCQGQHSRHHVGQIIDEIDAPLLDLLIDTGPHHFVDKRLPALDRRWRQVRIEGVAIPALFGRIHLENAGPQGDRLVWNRDPVVAAALTVRVVVVGDVRAASQFEHGMAAACDPVAAVGVRPSDRALFLQFLCDLLELEPVLRGMPIKIKAMFLAIAVGDGVIAHGIVSLAVSLEPSASEAASWKSMAMACSGHERAASRTSSC